MLLEKVVVKFYGGYEVLCFGFVVEFLIMLIGELCEYIDFKGKLIVVLYVN